MCGRPNAGESTAAGHGLTSGLRQKAMLEALRPYPAALLPAAGFANLAGDSDQHLLPGDSPPFPAGDSFPFPAGDIPRQTVLRRVSEYPPPLSEASSSNEKSRDFFPRLPRSKFENQLAAASDLDRKIDANAERLPFSPRRQPNSGPTCGVL